MGTLKRIAIILFLIFLLPALFFSVYEISSLNKDEEVINDIYEKQLEAILFSANQYSDDILNTWIVKLELGFNNMEYSPYHEEIEKLIDYNQSIEGVMIYDYDTLINGGTLKFRDFDNPVILKKTKAILNDKKELINKLIEYNKRGFQKIESIPIDYDEGLVALLFQSAKRKKDEIIMLILINPQLFIEENIGPRLQYLAQNRFDITVTKVNESSPIYSTSDSTNKNKINKVLTKDLWLLSGYQLAISTKGTSIEDVIKERSQTNLILIIVLDIILIFGVILVFQNVRKEVQLAQNKSDFISNVSHEIRTPLALISMFAETLELDRVSSEVKKKEYYSIISKETQRLTNIVNKILSFSKMDAGKKELTLQSVNITRIIKDVLEMYEYHLTKEGFTVIKKLKEDININADREAIVEVFINLLDNAIKYSDKDKKIEVEITSDTKYATLSIKDQGIGISKKNQQYIFDKFYRVPSGDLAKKQGTGLGLALVKQIINLHRGEIEIKSEEGKGAVFIIRLPLT